MPTSLVLAEASENSPAQNSYQSSAAMVASKRVWGCHQCTLRLDCTIVVLP